MTVLAAALAQAGCPNSARLEKSSALVWPDWHKRDFEEYDVDADPEALTRMGAATGGGQFTVPVLIEDGKVTQIGWQGRGCIISKDGGKA